MDSFVLQKNVGQNGGKPRLDLNVEAAWAQGFTGKNVTTAIMDDGVDYMHPDLRDNYVSIRHVTPTSKKILMLRSNASESLASGFEAGSHMTQIPQYDT